MMRVNLTESQRMQIEKKIHELGSVGDFATEQMEKQAKMFGLLPCHLELGGWYGLSPDGIIKSISWESKDEPKDERDIRIRNLVLHQASIRYPELELESPKRSESDRVCPYCGGSGQAPHSETIENLVCYCGGLGWIPQTN